MNTTSLDTRYYTETELTNGALDGRYYTETEAEAKFLRQDSSETIASGVTWSNSDAFVATTAAINARIVDLIDEVGGFTAIANETSFPTTNPQGATGQSAILSIAAASTTLTPTGTTLTIANGAGSGNTVTVTGVPTAIPQNFGFLVESTATTHTYTFHRLVPIATQVNTVASNITNIVNAGANVVDINNFADIYQISRVRLHKEQMEQVYKTVIYGLITPMIIYGYMTGLIGLSSPLHRVFLMILLLSQVRLLIPKTSD